jgi:hypothetical protein
MSGATRKPVYPPEATTALVFCAWARRAARSSALRFCPRRISPNYSLSFVKVSLCKTCSQFKPARLCNYLNIFRLKMLLCMTCEPPQKFKLRADLLIHCSKFIHVNRGRFPCLLKLPCPSPTFLLSQISLHRRFRQKNCARPSTVISSLANIYFEQVTGRPMQNIKAAEHEVVLLG